MRCTQKDIARLVGLDISSVNKILNKKPGAVFHKKTVQAVFAAAKTMGYQFDLPRSGRARMALQEIIDRGWLRGLVSQKKLSLYKRLAYGC